MAKIVIAGCSSCPYYGRAELLGDKLTKNLPDFNLHKIVKRPDEWETWLETVCSERGWDHNYSPLVWRELIDRGGKGVLIGGANEFQEYAQAYYAIESDLISDDMKKIAKENELYKIEIDKEEEAFRYQSTPLHVCLTNANSPVCYAMLNSIAKGDVFGEGTEIALHLYDSNEDNMEALSGLEMETLDLAHGLVREVTRYTNRQQAFNDCGAIVLMDEVEKGEDEDKSSWLKRNSDLFTTYAKVINEVAKKNVLVLLAGGGPLNFNAFMMIQNAPNIPRQNFAALSRTVENHAKAVIAERLKVNSAGVVDLIVWGNANGENYIDVNRCRVHGYDGAIWGPPSFSVPAKEMIFDTKWLEKEYTELVKGRGQKVEEALGRPASASCADAICTTLCHWWNGSPSGQMFSLGICSDGWYDVPEGLVFSYPVTMHPKGYWYVVQDIDLTDEMKDKIKFTVQDLLSEKYVMFPPPEPVIPTPDPTVPTPDPEPTSPVPEPEVTSADSNEQTQEQEADKPEGEEGEQKAEDGEEEERLETITEDHTEDKTGIPTAETTS